MSGPDEIASLTAEVERLTAENERLAKAWEAKHEYQVKQSKNHAEYFDMSQRRIRELMAERDTLAALPEVQALIAGAFEAAAKAVSDSEFDHPRRYNTFSRLADRIRAMIPADAIAARDARIAEAVAKEREACSSAP